MIRYNTIIVQDKYGEISDEESSTSEEADEEATVCYRVICSNN